ncbi:MAG: Gfo/Idh/MocA family protein, partial [Anaerolineales bacterium]
MIERSLKVGIIGTGFIGPAHVEALRRLGIEVAGVLDVTAEQARANADGMRIRHVYNSLEEMCSSDLDVIHITSPNYLHYEHAKAALQAGKHVVCEKPLAMDTSQSAELLALAEDKGLVTAVNFNLRFYPLVQQARAMLQAGELGEVHIIQGSYLQDWLLLPTDWNWRLEPELGGDMRAVADIGSHWLDLTGFISGLKVEAVLADFATFLPIRQKPKSAIETYSGKLQSAVEYENQPIHTEDYASILLRFKG